MRKLALFFTEGMSVKGWHDDGLLERDSLLYQVLGQHDWHTWFITYGAPDDGDYLPPDAPITVLAKPSASMSHREYGRNIIKLHGDVLRGVDVIKSHQINGSRYAAMTSLRLRKPYLARCGYLVSVFLAQEQVGRRRKLKNAMEEFFAFHTANTICVPSQTEIDYLHQRYRINRQKAHACPNWIDTERFKPDPSIPKNPRQVCFVGRFQPQKDPLLVLEAIKDIPDIELVMIGGGAMQAQIEAKIAEYHIKAQVYPRVDNEALPRYLNQSALYVLPTLYEGGSPKTLLEAMSCGLPVVSTSAFGADEAFQGDGIHGYKCEPQDVNGIRTAIINLLEKPAEAAAMGQRGRQHIIDHFSIDRAVERELARLNQLIR